MKCPRCNKAISLFSPSINSLGSRDRKCPHCGASVRTKIRHKWALLVVLGVDLVAMIVALSLSPKYWPLLIMAGSAIAAILGIVALAQFELLSGEPRGERRL